MVADKVLVGNQHFPVPSADLPRHKRVGRVDRAVIMGDLDLGRRHFDRIFEQLEEAIRRERCRLSESEGSPDHIILTTQRTLPYGDIA